MDIQAKYVSSVVDTLLREGAKRATKYMFPKLIIRATQPTFGGKLRRNGDNIDVRLTIGRPNFAERAYIEKLVKAGEPFPVKKIALKFPKLK